ncbi:TetR/AcrR family transcriptional regulator [Bacillus sp. sid0103]|uniref:TetR/AcrR family transcriptional regulator n=1 Tax=Bacillus sp. sid0103 TaxID=2856337 RepID=UPI001C44E03B|nr:TetR/AcrR family transcriptional regulator [Bacillus sp. sid0103]MBV7508141.1 TetR/AcrR family transcriptional regulator [Bacillus sp. sid0103]
MSKMNMEAKAMNQTETYQLIIQTARGLFMEQGYRAVSTRQIAKICGVTQPALYHHFKNKQTLYVAVMQQTLHQTEVDLNGLLSQFTTFQERLTQIALYMAAHFEMDMSQMFHDISHELHPNDQQQLYQSWIKAFLTPVENMINDGVSKEEIKNPARMNTTTTQLAYLILNFIKSILEPENTARLSVKERQTKAEEKAKLMVKIFIYGMRA